MSPESSMSPLRMIALLALLAPAQALAYGPGVHVREADRTLELLAADPSWAAAAATPAATTWLRAGAISPDFQWLTGALGFGHAKTLSYHLLDVADTPERRLFALGHLTHICSDASAETFLTPTLFASAPLGMFDLFAGYDDARGESEAICEGVGDFVFGDWDAVVDLLYDVYLGGPGTEELFVAIFDWYCAEGAAWSGVPVQCEAAREDVQSKLDQAKGLFGGFDREGAKELLHQLIDMPLPALLDAVGGGFASALLGARASKGPHFAAEMARAKESALVDPALWDLYEQSFAELGPLLAVDHLELRPTGWPAYEGKALISGNLQSILRFLPAAYAFGQGLHVDDVAWLDADGEPVTEVDAALAGQPLVARARLFAGLPVAGTVRAVVRKDLPGFTTQGPVVGEAELAVDLDPARSTWEPRPIIEVPFTADTAGALGFVLEFTLNSETRPWFTTSFDRAWTIPSLPLHWPVYTDNFGTYGHWPPSLPVAPEPSTPGALLVRARQHPSDKAVPGVLVTIAETQSGALTAANGVARFEPLPPGSYTVDAGGTWVSRGPATAEVTSLGVAWAHLSLEAVPMVSVSGAWTAEPCVPFTWDAAAFEGLATGFEARAVDAWSDAELLAPADTGTAGEGALCVDVADGLKLKVAVRAVYPDGAGLAEGRSAAIGVDRSGPTLTAGPTVKPLKPDACLTAGVPTPTLVPVTITASWEEPHSFVAAVRIAFGDGPWLDLPVPDDGPWKAHVDPTAVGASVQDPTLRLRIVNGAGVATTSAAVTLPVWGEERRCPVADVGGPDAGEDATDTNTSDAGEDAAKDSQQGEVDAGPTPETSGGGGCGTGAPATRWATPLVLMLLTLLAIRRRAA